MVAPVLGNENIGKLLTVPSGVKKVIVALLDSLVRINVCFFSTFTFTLPHAFDGGEIIRSAPLGVGVAVGVAVTVVVAVGVTEGVPPLPVEVGVGVADRVGVGDAVGDPRTMQSLATFENSFWTV